MSDCTAVKSVPPEFTGWDAFLQAYLEPDCLVVAGNFGRSGGTLATGSRRGSTISSCTFGDRRLRATRPMLALLRRFGPTNQQMVVVCHHALLHRRLGVVFGRFKGRVPLTVFGDIKPPPRLRSGSARFFHPAIVGATVVFERKRFEHAISDEVSVNLAGWGAEM